MSLERIGGGGDDLVISHDAHLWITLTALHARRGCRGLEWYYYESLIPDLAGPFVNEDDAREAIGLLNGTVLPDARFVVRAKRYMELRAKAGL
jgi:hypothetical protein